MSSEKVIPNIKNEGGILFYIWVSFYHPNPTSRGESFGALMICDVNYVQINQLY